MCRHNPLGCKGATLSTTFIACVRYIVVSLFYMSKREHLQKKEIYFLYHFESSSRA